MRFSKTGLGETPPVPPFPSQTLRWVVSTCPLPLPYRLPILSWNTTRVFFLPSHLTDSHGGPPWLPSLAELDLNVSVLFTYLLAALGLGCCTRAFSGGGEQGYSPLWSAGSGLRELRYAGSAVVAHGLSYPSACGIFLDQGLNSQFPELADGFSTTGPPG